MYFLYSRPVLRAPCLLRTSQGLIKLYRTHKILPRVEHFKPELSTQSAFGKVINAEKQNTDIQSPTELEFSSIHCPIKPLSIIDSGKSMIDSEKWREVQLDTSKLGHYYLRLSKYRLTSLVVMTSMIGYVMAPNPFELTSFLSCTIGTGLVSSAANSINQFLEVPFDAQMSRTRNRVLVQGLLSPLHAVGFALASGCLGLLTLCEGANTLTAILGASNLVLYTMIYTPLKRISILNTWVGSLVGAIPPMMGWAACQGSLDTAALILGGILYAWQFPHFNALSWNLRPDYSKAGYRMMAVTNPGLCRRTALRYTLGITAFSSLAPIVNLTHWSFGVFSLPVNLYFVILAFRFYKESDSKSSRKLFRFSLLHLPLLMGLMLITREGLLSSEITPEKSSVEENIPSKTGSGCFTGLSLGTTLHAQVK